MLRTHTSYICHPPYTDQHVQHKFHNHGWRVCCPGVRPCRSQAFHQPLRLSPSTSTASLVHVVLCHPMHADCSLLVALQRMNLHCSPQAVYAGVDRHAAAATYPSVKRASNLGTHCVPPQYLHSTCTVPAQYLHRTCTVPTQYLHSSML